MKIEILYFDWCPTYRVAEQTLQGVLAEQDLEATVELVAVNTDDEARQLWFSSSPTIRVDGRDLFPVPAREDWRLGCRVYATPEGLRGSPTTEMFKETLPKAADLSQGRSQVLDRGYAGSRIQPSENPLPGTWVNRGPGVELRPGYGK